MDSSPKNNDLPYIHAIPNLYDSLYVVKHKSRHLAEFSHYFMKADQTQGSLETIHTTCVLYFKSSNAYEAI